MFNIGTDWNPKQSKLKEIIKKQDYIDDTIAWNIWHMTRIEDITANMLIMDSSQILDDEWLEKMSIQVKDTGNAMTH